MQRSLRITNFAFHHRSPKLDICVSVLYFFMQEQKYRDLYGENGFFSKFKKYLRIKIKKKELTSLQSSVYLSLVRFLGPLSF